MARPLSRVPLLALAAFALAACDGETPVRCDPPPNLEISALPEPAGPSRLSQVAPVAVWVTVVDSVTGADLTPGASGAYVTGSLADSLRHDFPTLLTAYGQPGRYSLVVSHPGYSAWGADDVRVERDPCGPEAAEVTARLRPLENAR